MIDNRLWSRWQSEDVPVRLGISSCLLGRSVRYDGGHCRDRFLVDQLGAWVEWRAVCPEQEAGMSTPRPAIRLVEQEGDVRLVEPKSGHDWTDTMLGLAERRVDDVTGDGLDGYVLKKSSPSCALERLKVYTEHGSRKDGVGMFTRVLAERAPLLPLEEEGRLNDPLLRANFVERVFCRNRWRVLCVHGLSRKRLVEFHTAHKLLLRCHGEVNYAALGRLVGSAGELPDQELFEQYERLFHAALAELPKIMAHVNVMQHAFGYLKDVLDRRDKAAILAAIEDFRLGLLPMLVPLSLMRFHVEKHQIPYLSDQLYLDPHPKELMLRKRA
ncbi:MAG: DUF1722 domain-containing protein [bacterium]|nr:DUF1722 domain-containing protein [bacterium]